MLKFESRDQKLSKKQFHRNRQFLNQMRKKLKINRNNNSLTISKPDGNSIIKALKHKKKSDNY